MSRYSLKPLSHRADLFEVAVGWDSGLDTYFITVFGPPEVQREPEVRLWRGNVWRDLATTQELITIAERYAMVPADLAVTLEQDRNVERQELRSPISRVISQLLGHLPKSSESASSPAPQYARLACQTNTARYRETDEGTC